MSQLRSSSETPPERPSRPWAPKGNGLPPPLPERRFNTSPRVLSSHPFRNKTNSTEKLISSPPLSSSAESPGSKFKDRPVARITGGTIRDRQKTISKLYSTKRIELRIDAHINDAINPFSRGFDANSNIGEVVKQLSRRFPESEGQSFGLFIPSCAAYKNGAIMDPKKKLSDYDEETLIVTPLEFKSTKATTLRKKERVPTIGRKDGKKEKEQLLRNTPPPPSKFLVDPNSRITVTEMTDRSIAINFEYTHRSYEWSKPDIEGELLKQGRYMQKNFKPRWFILQDCKLFVFKTRPMPGDVGNIPSVGLNLNGGSVTRSKLNKPFALDCTGMDEITQKITTVTMVATNSEEFKKWEGSMLAAITSKVLQSRESLKQQNITISFDPSKGYVGLPDDWKKMLEKCGITQRYFYERPEEVLQMLKYFYSAISEPIVPHSAPKTRAKTAIEEVVNTSAAPTTLYEDFVLIGSGTFGEVYRALNKITKQPVAIKKMLLTPKREPLFISEINIQRNTEHPNVVKLFEAYKVADHVWVALEYMEGGNLYQILSAFEESKQLLTEPQIAYIVLETLKALSYIHGLHRIHRDIKSDNILIGRNSEVKIADFGYAVQLTNEGEKRTTMAGSPYWMAPEIIEGEEYGKEVDLWSLGIMVMECCDLQPPYINEPPSKALMLITTQPPPPLQRPDRWSKEVKHFISVCLQRDPLRRPQAIELMMHPMLRCTCTAKEFRDTVLTSSRKSTKPCSIQ